MKPFIYVALDYDNQAKVFEGAKRLADVGSDRYGFKVNLDSVADFSPGSVGPNEFIRTMNGYAKDRPLFVDLKMWNGGRTMANIAKGCADVGVDIINTYAHAGPKFIQKVAKVLEGSKTKLFALTVLTHYTDEDAMQLYGCNLACATSRLAQMAVEGGAHGIIVPGTQLDVVQSLEVLKLVPAVRPTWYEDKKVNDQEQPVTPEEAVKGGANYLVVGSPITKSENPVQALERILQETDA